MTSARAAFRNPDLQGSRPACRPAAGWNPLPTPRSCRVSGRPAGARLKGWPRARPLSEYLIASLAVFGLLCATLL